MKIAAAVMLLVLGLSGCGDEKPGERTQPSVDASSPTASAGTPSSIASPQQQTPTVVIDPDVFTYQEDLGYSKETFVVTGAEDTGAVVAALKRAARRFMRVDETGEEHFSEASASEAYSEGLYTPNYVSDPRITRRGVQLYLDCKSSIEDPMAVTLRTILRQELLAAGVHVHVKAVA